MEFQLDPDLSTQLGGYTEAEFKRDVQMAHFLKGQLVVISLNGAEGNITVSDAAGAERFAASIYSLLQRFGFDGVDVDFGHELDVTYMTQALRSLAARAPGLIITMAPQTSNMTSAQSPYFQLALPIADLLTMVNTQYYDSGSMIGCDKQTYDETTEDFMMALACIQLQGGLHPDQIGLGRPSSPDAVYPYVEGYVSPSVGIAGRQCVAIGTNCGAVTPEKTYPTIRGAMAWSINFDAVNHYSFAFNVSAALAALS